MSETKNFAFATRFLSRTKTGFANFAPCKRGGGGHWELCNSAFSQFFFLIPANANTEIYYFYSSLGL